MTINVFKVQRLLQLLGQDIQADGYWGPISEAALDAEIAKRQPDDSLNWWTGIKWFDRSEMSCSCGRCGGFPAEPSQKLMRMADDIRSEINLPMTVSSGVRCPEHNAEVGGVANSRHLKGCAMDVRAIGMTVDHLLAIVKRHPSCAYAYKITNDYIHMDVVE